MLCMLDKRCVYIYVYIYIYIDRDVKIETS